MSSANTRVKRWCGNVLANVSARVGFVPSNNSSDVVNANVGNSNTFADAKSLSLAPSKYNPVALSAWENDPGDESKKSAVDEADEAVELQSISQPDAFRASDLNEDSPRRALTGSPSNDQNPTGSINSNLIDNRVSQEHTQLVDVEVTRDVDVDKDEYMSHVTYWVPNILKSVTKRGFAIICLSVLSSVAIVFFYWMIAAITWYVHTILLERRSCVVGSNGLPDLNLNSKITISGSSAGGDMAVQFHFAFSRLVIGACGFTGQPYRCAITRFTNETLAASNSSCKEYECGEPYKLGLAVPECLDASGDPCPGNKTVMYDHCKFFPERVKIGELEHVVNATAVCRDKHEYWNLSAPSCIDPPDTGLLHARVYLFRGLYDNGHRAGTCRNTGDLYARWVNDRERQIQLRDNMRIGHAVPMPWMCRGNTINGQSLDTKFAHQSSPCEGPPTDGAGECMRWVLNDVVQNPPFVWDQWYQTKIPTDWLSQYHLHTRVEIPADSVRFPEQDAKFYVFIPRPCRKGARCRLHVNLYGCHDAPHHPLALKRNGGYARKDARLLTSNYHLWAATNRIVVLYPIGPINPRRNTEHPNWGNTGAKECWDAYGETGVDYATQKGLHMRQIRHAIWLVSKGRI
ncbi:hypothetical protein AAMO2058_001714600 [Amorphochlora amoebiformis]